MGYDGFDDNDDPVQHGLLGYQDDSDGITYIRGPCLGVVLSVHYSDDPDNLLYRFLRGEKDDGSRASYLEASVLLLYGGVDMFIELDHVAILQGKCGFRGLTEGEPADWSEDIPNGCTEEELEGFYAQGATGGTDTLSGDWVVVDFLGGVLQLPMITRWFPNPRNQKDASTKDIGKRFLIRRNNSELQIDKNGDLHLTHRVGQYIQMRGETITIKHKKGQTIHLDEEGYISFQDGKGNSISSSEKGWSVNANGCAVMVQDGNVDIYATGTNGKMRFVSRKIDLLASDIYASAGGGSIAAGGGIKALVTENLIPAFQSDVSDMTKLLDMLSTFIHSLLTATDPATKAAAGIMDPLLTILSKSRAGLITDVNNAYKDMLTKVLKGE